MTQNLKVPQTCTETKTCSTCTFLILKDSSENGIIQKCALSNLPKNPNTHACQYHEEGNRII